MLLEDTWKWKTMFIIRKRRFSINHFLTLTSAISFTRLSLTSSAVAATGRPVSWLTLLGRDGTVPGIGAGRTTVGSTAFWIGFNSALGMASFVSGWDEEAAKTKIFIDTY